MVAEELEVDHNCLEYVSKNNLDQTRTWGDIEVIKKWRSVTMAGSATEQSLPPRGRLSLLL